MGQKVNPIGFRIGVNKDWNSTWVASKKDIGTFLKEDHTIREHIMNGYACSQNNCSISKVTIERQVARVVVNIYTGRPGMLIGQKGAGIEKLKKELQKIVGTKTLELNVREVKNADINAVLVAQSIATQLEKRISWRRAMKMAMQKAIKGGAKGVKVMVGGRLDGADIARSEFYQQGILPLHTIRSDIDFGFAEATTTFGIIGVKCWICHGEIKGKTRRIGEVTRANRGERKENDRRFDRKPGFGDRKPFDPNRSHGERRPFDPNRPQGERKPFDPNRPQGERKPFDPTKPQGERRPFNPNFKPRDPNFKPRQPHEGGQSK